jgi:hypothetical protein
MTVKQKQCKTCGETKPTTQFKRTLTLAQTKALLKRRDITQRHTLISSLCKACQATQKRNKRTNPLRPKEIAMKIQSGDIHPVVGEMRIRKAKQFEAEKKSQAQKERWRKEKLREVNEALERLRTEVAGYRNRYYTYQRHLQNTYEQIIPVQHALLEQHRWNYEQAKLHYNATVKPKYIAIQRGIDKRGDREGFINLRMDDLFTPNTDATIDMQDQAGMYPREYDMTGLMVSARSDKWWLVVKDMGEDIQVIDPMNPPKPNARPHQLKKKSINMVQTKGEVK